MISVVAPRGYCVRGSPAHLCIGKPGFLSRRGAAFSSHDLVFRFHPRARDGRDLRCPRTGEFNIQSRDMCVPLAVPAKFNCAVPLEAPWWIHCAWHVRLTAYEMCGLVRTALAADAAQRRRGYV